jgi:hypothetical protein
MIASPLSSQFKKIKNPLFIGGMGHSKIGIYVCHCLAHTFWWIKKEKTNSYLSNQRHLKKCSCHMKGNNEYMLVILKVRKNNAYLTNLQCMMIYAWKIRKNKSNSQVSTHGQVLALPNPNLRASLVPSQSLDPSQSFNLIHPSSLTMGSRLGITFPFFLMCIFQPIWHNNHWQTKWPFLTSLWQMVLVILTSIACYMQTRIFQTKCCIKFAFEHIWNCYVCAIVWIDVDNMNWRTIFDIWCNNKR